MVQFLGKDAGCLPKIDGKGTKSGQCHEFRESFSIPNIALESVCNISALTMAFKPACGSSSVGEVVVNGRLVP